MTEEQKKLVEPALNTIVNDDIRKFAETLVDNLPKYIWEVGASSTGKYHPAYSLGVGGLMRHQVAVVRFLNFFLELDQYGADFADRQKDLMRVAALVHDGRKSGDQADYEKSKYTKFDHPLKMAEVIRNTEGLNTEEKEYIANCIESHMGQWNVDKKSNIKLPKPEETHQELVHLADYLASRKDLSVSFDNYEVHKPEPIDISTWKFSFGKHKDELAIDVYKSDPDYLEWCEENIQRRDVQEVIKALKNSIKQTAEIDEEDIDI